MITRYLLWDHDGVLVDTERWYFEATRISLAELDIGLSQERYLEFMAVGRTSWELARERGIPEEEIQAKREVRNGFYQEFLRTKPVEIDGVEEVLAELAPAYRMAIVTTSRRCDFELIHEDRDLLRHFEFVLTVEDYPRSKPHPDPYLAGLASFGATPDQALVIEDTSRGLTSAKAAGIRCLVIRNEFTASQDFTGAWRVVNSIRDLPCVLNEQNSC